MKFSRRGLLAVAATAPVAAVLPSAASVGACGGIHRSVLTGAITIAMAGLVPVAIVLDQSGRIVISFGAPAGQL